MKNLTIYRSSAGSGKTYTLVKEYLQIALKYPFHFQKILAITFTNKATAEMKSRIIKALSDLSTGKDSGLAKDLEKSITLTDCTLQERAHEVLTNIIHHYSDFSVSTIDSFFNEIVKSLAHELKLSLRFEIEIDQDLIISKACDQLLELVGSDKELRLNLERFIEYKMEYDKGWRIQNELRKIAEHLFSDSTTEIRKQKDENDYQELIKELRMITGFYEKSMSGYGKAFIASIEKNGYSIDSFSYKKSGVAGYFQKIISVQSPTEYQPKTRVSDAYTNSDKWISEASRKDAKLVQLIQEVYHPMLSELINFHVENFTIYNSAYESLKLIYVSSILNKINQEVIHYRDQNSIITLNDANKLIRSSVNSSDTPLVFEKTGNFFAHYLLDEFQDTSTIQWENIRPLINEVLSNNKSALLVGDVKQSIYRWRGGNMDLLHSGVEKDLAIFKEQIGIQQLSINYRSSKQIVDFNNTFFIKAPSILEQYIGVNLPLVKEAYGEELLQQQMPAKYDVNGFIRVNILDKNIKNGNDDEDRWKERSLKLMLEQIHELLALNYRYNDIAILVRNNKDGNLIANYLYANGIHQVLSNDSLLLSKASQVIFIVNCLRLILNPQNPLLQVEIEWYLTDQSKIKDLHHFFTRDHLHQKENPLLISFLKLVKENSTTPVDEMVTLIINHFGMNKIPDAYIQRFQDIIFEYLQKNLSDLNSFIKWWDDAAERKSFSVVMPETSNAIQILTIHKAKGLQFPIVILPITEWNLKPKSGGMLWAPAVATPPFNKLDEWPLQINKNLEETVFKNSYLQKIEENYIDNLNLLYVAFTRACQQLHITVLRKNESNEKTNSDFIFQTLRSFDSFNSDSDSFIIGSLNPNGSQSGEDATPSLFAPQTDYLNEYPVNKWQNKLLLSVEKSFTSSEIETGNRIHQALSFIHHEKQLTQALLKIKSLYHLNQKETIELERNLLDIFELCKSHNWFDGTYHSVNESIFSTANNEILRPDRVMIKDKKAIVIDYKTGEENDSNNRQACSYKQLLMECGYTDVESWLVYTVLKKLVEVL